MLVTPPTPKRHADMTVEELMRETGFDRGYARFFLAMARGELDGDLEDVDEPEEPVPPKR